MTEPTCRTCHFWWFEGTPTYGECRRYPPRQELRFATGQINFVVTFPNVGSYEWCGEHKPALSEGGGDAEEAGD